ncbi:t121 [Tupaiid betaherpesvirus 1]|uniref:T121 n=1 Tax=Tupaiid herpesvirus 1 (strain 1) TaxID=10397 RepID=Q91TI0_TUHV1|nr:t121 [Tupaiid betaherpesvirus 1]AAK57167.1 t121 [Tupaiid betaherpesvirus 1]
MPVTTCTVGKCWSYWLLAILTPTAILAERPSFVLTVGSSYYDYRLRYNCTVRSVVEPRRLNLRLRDVSVPARWPPQRHPPTTEETETAGSTPTEVFGWSVSVEARGSFWGEDVICDLYYTEESYRCVLSVRVNVSRVTECTERSQWPVIFSMLRGRPCRAARRARCSRRRPALAALVAPLGHGALAPVDAREASRPTEAGRGERAGHRDGAGDGAGHGDAGAAASVRLAAAVALLLTAWGALLAASARGPARHRSPKPSRPLRPARPA